MRITPLQDRVLIRRSNDKERTKSGIYLAPNQDSDRPSTGTVLKVGPDVSSELRSIQPNHKVVFGKYSGTEVEINRKKYLLVREEEIIAVIDTQETTEKEVK